MKKKIQPIIFAAIICLLSLAASSGCELPSAAVKYPLKVGPNNRYLVDQNNVPVFMNGDMPWLLFGALSREDITFYLSYVAGKGVNSIVVEFPSNLFKRNQNGTVTDYYGQRPFHTSEDFTTPNESYFAHGDWAINEAAKFGIQVLVSPFFTDVSFNRVGWWTTNWENTNSIEDCRWYGEYIGNRYKDFPNIIWIIGNDREPGTLRDKLDAMARGIRAKDPNHLLSYQSASGLGHTPREVWPPSTYPWLTLNCTYNYPGAATTNNDWMWKANYANYNGEPVMPFFLWESRYENEANNVHSQGYDGSPFRSRLQAYQSVLCGAMGHNYGNGYIFPLGTGYNGSPSEWKPYLYDPGYTQLLPNIRKLMESRAWYNLVPDQDHMVITAGYGSEDNYAPCAITSNGETVIAYLPDKKTVTVDMSRISGKKVKCWWYNPRTGESMLIGSYPNKAPMNFTNPDTSDWVLVLDDASKRLPAPGTISYTSFIQTDTVTVSHSATVRHTEKLRVSSRNPYLMETISGKPLFLNNYTVWLLIMNGKREDISGFFDFCVNNKYNAVSVQVLEYPQHLQSPGNAGLSAYGSYAFERDSRNLPDPLKPITTKGNDPSIAGQYDYWDHLDFIIDQADSRGLYVFLHPAWGDWFSGGYGGENPGDPVIFNETTAYKYGRWIAGRYKARNNIIWMLGGDRSAVFFPGDPKTYKWVSAPEYKDYRTVYRAMAEGLADGNSGINKQDGKADYKNMMISFHPRKWAPNSSEWFHNDPWLKFNSIQDDPQDQVDAIPHDYTLTPPKPTWIYEPRYEGIKTGLRSWGLRYQAYQTVFAGAFGFTYGADELFKFPSTWRELINLPGSLQMKHLCYISREIWTDRQYIDRFPDQELIIGDQGKTYGDRTFQEGVAEVKILNPDQIIGSDRITAIRGGDGKWALVYSANGRDIVLNLARLYSGDEVNGYWYNPRNGKWWANGSETGNLEPFIKGIKTGAGIYAFDPPGDPKAENDWVLVLKK